MTRFGACGPGVVGVLVTDVDFNGKHRVRLRIPEVARILDP